MSDIEISTYMRTYVGEGWEVYVTECGVHVVPEGEQHDHDDMCRCKPTIDELSRRWIVWVHHSFDRREHTRERQ